MGKVLLFMSVLILLFVGIGTYKIPNDPIFWLASSSIIYQVIRILLGIFLLAQVLTNPPRKIWFRAVTGLVATSIAGWALAETYNFTMPPLDTFIFLSASTALLITALERSIVVEPKILKANKESSVVRIQRKRVHAVSVM